MGASSSSPSSTSPQSKPNLISIYSTQPKIQNFSFPENIIFYISKNPSSAKVYGNLSKSCKYFYLKNPMISFNDLWFPVFPSAWKATKINKIEFNIDKDEMKKLPQKIWIYGCLNVSDIRNKNSASSLASKIYRCDINYLELRYQSLTFNEFKLFTSSKKIKRLNFDKVKVVNSDGKILVPIEKWIECLPNLEEFSFNEDENGPLSITSETAENLFEIPHFKNLKDFTIFDAPEIFDFETFFNNLKKPWKMEIKLWYNSNISNNYSQRLQNFVDEIIAEGITENRPPNICSDELLLNHTWRKLGELENAYIEKYEKKSIWFFYWYLYPFPPNLLFPTFVFFSLILLFFIIILLNPTKYKIH